MWSGCLDSSTIFRNPGLDSGGSESSWEFLWLSLNSFADRNSEDFFVDSEVKLQVIIHLSLGLLVGSMGCMALLPQKFSSSDEGSRMFEFPSDDVGPLVEFERQISVTLDPICIGRIHNGLTGWSDSDWLGEIAISWTSDPSDLRSKALDVLLFDF